MASNEELSRRADLALSDFASNGGLLLPEQADTFIDMIFDTPTILPQVRKVRMTAPSVKVNRLGFGTRIMRAAAQTGGALDAGGNDRYVRVADRSKPTSAQIQLNTSEFIAEIRIPYEMLEDNIEGMSFEQHVMRLIADQAARDFEELGLFADTAIVGSDPYLGQQDGWLKRMTLNVVNNANAGVSPDMFMNGLLAMPQQYLRDITQLKHFITVANEIKYRNLVAKRATGYGDSMLQTATPIYAHGVAVEKAPMLNAGGAGKLGFLTYPQNLLFGIQRDVSVETDKDIRSREIIIVLTTRIALQIDDNKATVKYTNIN